MGDAPHKTCLFLHKKRTSFPFSRSGNAAFPSHGQPADYPELPSSGLPMVGGYTLRPVLSAFFRSRRFQGRVTIFRKRAYQAVEHVVHGRIHPSRRDACKIDAGGVDGSVSQALPDQFHRIPRFQHQGGPGVPQHVGGQRSRQPDHPAYGPGMAVHAPQGALFRELSGLPLFPWRLSFPAPAAFLLVQEGEHVRRVLPAMPPDDGFRLGSDFHVYQAPVLLRR